jgi:hypothetical protein
VVLSRHTIHGFGTSKEVIFEELTFFQSSSNAAGLFVLPGQNDAMIFW